MNIVRLVFFFKKANDSLYDLTNMVVNAIGSHKYDGTINGWDYDWTFENSLLFTITIMSTIGYGHIAPKTFGGKMFVLVYALLGLSCLFVCIVCSCL
jgi:hypothetical protein